MESIQLGAAPAAAGSSAAHTAVQHLAAPPGILLRVLLCQFPAHWPSPPFPTPRPLGLPADDGPGAFLSLRLSFLGGCDQWPLIMQKFFLSQCKPPGRSIPGKQARVLCGLTPLGLPHSTQALGSLPKEEIGNAKRGHFAKELPLLTPQGERTVLEEGGGPAPQRKPVQLPPGSRPETLQEGNPHGRGNTDTPGLRPHGKDRTVPDAALARGEEQKGSEGSSTSQHPLPKLSIIERQEQVKMVHATLV